MKATIKADRLKEVHNVISVIVDECKITFSKAGVKIKGVDPAHVAMFDVKLDKTAFEEYECIEDTEIGLSLVKLGEVIKLAQKDDIISIEHDTVKNAMVFKIGRITRRMQLIDSAGMSDPKVPNLTLPNTVIISSDQLRLGLKASSSVADHIILECSGANEAFRLKAEGDTDTSTLELTKDQLESIDSKQASRSLFPSDYFGKIIKAISSKNVKIEMGNDFPCKLIWDSMDDNFNVIFLLAPGIEGE